MSDTTTPLLSAVDIETHALDLTESTWSRINKLDQHEYLSVAKRCIVKGIELASAKLLAENAALRERLAVLEGKGVEPVLEKDAAHVCDLLTQLHGEFYGKGMAHADAFRVLPKVVALIKSDASLRAAAQVAADALVREEQSLSDRLEQAVSSTMRDQLTNRRSKVRTALAALAEQGVKPTLKS